MTSNDRLLTSKEVADLLGVNRRTVQVWAKDGTLPAVKIGRLLRFSREAINAKLKELSHR